MEAVISRSTDSCSCTRGTRLRIMKRPQSRKMLQSDHSQFKGKATGPRPALEQSRALSLFHNASPISSQGCKTSGIRRRAADRTYCRPGKDRPRQTLSSLPAEISICLCVWTSPADPCRRKRGRHYSKILTTCVVSDVVLVRVSPTPIWHI